MSSGHCHIHFEIVQQSRGSTALTRLAYQSCTYVNDGGRREDYTPYKLQHLGGVILLPPGANAEFADAGRFAMAVGFRENRRDAQAGRTVDFSLPRELPNGLLLPVASFVMAHFAVQGMAARVDVECPSASDDDRNPHGHAYIAQRFLESDGFGLKAREWNRQFRRESGRHLRALIAGRITLACALLGIAAFVDPRRNDERGRPAPEERIPRKILRMNDRLAYLAPIEDLKARRRERKSAEAVSTACVWPDGPAVIKSGIPRAISNAQRNWLINFVVQFAQEMGIEARGSNGNRGEIELITRDGVVIFDGETFTIPDAADPAQATLVIALAQALEWPALVVEGNSASTDEILLAGVPVGIIPINTCAGDDVLLLIKKKFGHLLADEIRPLDPLSVMDGVIGMIRANSEEMERAQGISEGPAESLSQESSSTSARPRSAPAADFQFVEMTEPLAAEEEYEWLDIDGSWQDDDAVHAEFEDHEGEPEFDPSFDDDELREPEPDRSGI